MASQTELGNRGNVLSALAVAVKELQRSYRMALRHIAKKHRISLELAWPLVMISWHGSGLDTKTLAQIMEFQIAQLTSLLTQLASDKLVEISEDGASRGSRLVSLTAEGQSLVDRIERDILDLRMTLVRDVSDADLETCLRTVTALTQQLDIK